MNETELYTLLERRGIAYETMHHPAVLTVAEADELVPNVGLPTKNLFLRDDKKRQFFVVVAHADTQIDLRNLHRQLGSRRLSFASPEALRDMLGLELGSVTPFGILNDESRSITLVFDERLAHQKINAHPLVNTATMFIELDEVLPLFTEHGNPIVFCDLTCGGR